MSFGNTPCVPKYPQYCIIMSWHTFSHTSSPLHVIVHILHACATGIQACDGLKRPGCHAMQCQQTPGAWSALWLLQIASDKRVNSLFHEF